MQKIKISVITVVKNGMPFLEEAIKSYDNQILADKEHIIVYSKSTDNTETFLEKYKKDKVIIYDNKSTNKFGSLNLGIKMANGEIIGILHADDVYPNNQVLQDVYDLFEYKKSDVIFGNVQFCKKDNLDKITRYWNSGEFNFKKLKYGWMAPHTSIYVKNEIIRKNLYDENYLISGDYEFFLKIFSNKKLSINFIDKNLCTMRMGGDSTKISSLILKFKEDIRISKKFFKNSILCVILKILRKINQISFKSFLK